VDPTLRTRLDERAHDTRAFLETHATSIARLCEAMAERFAAGGRLMACGVAPTARSDVRRVAVEFVHPVAVGKRALPALGLTGECGPLSLQIDLTARPDDIILAFPQGGECEPILAETLEVARSRGCLTVSFGAGGEWNFAPTSRDPFVRQELVEALHHLLWEMVHPFLERTARLEREGEGRHRDPGARGRMPLLPATQPDADGVLESVRNAVLARAAEVAELRERTVLGSAAALAAAAAGLRRALNGGGTVLAVGNGGSATDAMDAVADLRTPPHGWPARSALDLVEDTAVLTGLANDIGADAIFSSQVIAYGRPGDALLAFSTSGDPRNIIRALDEGRRRGLFTVALVGGDGGRIADEVLAHAVIISPSQHIPRIQEAQATAWHLLRELMERPQ
jgi:D-sedoheptulose 7-phosphate isomerase